MNFNTLLIVAVFVAVCIINKNQTKGLKKIMATLQERFDAVNAKLDTGVAKLTEASAEILAELTKLREGGNLTPEQEASLANIENKANAVADAATALADTSPSIDEG